MTITLKFQRLLWWCCKIVDIDVLLGRAIQYFCSEVLFDAPGRHFQSEIQHPASKIQYLCYKVLLDGSGRHFHGEI